VGSVVDDCDGAREGWDLMLWVCVILAKLRLFALRRRVPLWE
jgi:hypothetical protein